MPILIYIDIFIFGLAIGSFLNNVIHRIYSKESFVYGRSYCPQCGHSLEWKDLVPVVSFLLLKGKCRYCHKPISWQYPLVELFTGVLFLAVFALNIDIFFDFLIFGVLKISYLFFVVSSLIVIAVYDLKYYLISNKVIYSLIGGISFWYIVSSSFFKTYSLAEILNFFIVGFYSALFFWVVNLLTNGKGMGMGDVKLAFFMGLFLGYPSILVALFLSFFLGSVVGVALIFLKKKKFKSEVPFAPFLVTGTFLMMFFNQWFLNLNLFNF